ncbi:hypothetical protein DMUE_3594 [Dictyocoela muelleri]|nr:hypothetical protein DMUE_3594 [Dictyocoela muelleri]
MKTLTTICYNTILSPQKHQSFKEILNFITLNPDQRKNIWRFDGIQLAIIQEIIESYEYLQNESIESQSGELGNHFYGFRSNRDHSPANCFNGFHFNTMNSNNFKFDKKSLNMDFLNYKNDTPSTNTFSSTNTPPTSYYSTNKPSTYSTSVRKTTLSPNLSSFHRNPNNNLNNNPNINTNINTNINPNINPNNSDSKSFNKPYNTSFVNNASFIDNNESESIAQDNNFKNNLINDDSSKKQLNPSIITILKILENLTLDKEIRNDFLNSCWEFFIFPFLNNSSKHQKNEELTIISLKIVDNLIECKEFNLNSRESFKDSQYFHNSFLNESLKNKFKDFNNIRQTSLPMIAIEFIQNTEIIPLLLKIMDYGNMTSKFLSLRIFYDIISNKEVREYACHTFERFVAINIVLNSTIIKCCKCHDNYYLNLKFKNYVSHKCKDDKKVLKDEFGDNFKDNTICEDDMKILRMVLNCYITLCQIENVRSSFKSKMPKAFNEEKVLVLIEKDKESKELFKRFNSFLEIE